MEKQREFLFFQKFVPSLHQVKELRKIAGVWMGNTPHLHNCTTYPCPAPVLFCHLYPIL